MRHQWDLVGTDAVLRQILKHLVVSENSTFKHLACCDGLATQQMSFSLRSGSRGDLRVTLVRVFQVLPCFYVWNKGSGHFDPSQNLFPAFLGVLFCLCFCWCFFRLDGAAVGSAPSPPAVHHLTATLHLGLEKPISSQRSMPVCCPPSRYQSGEEVLWLIGLHRWICFTWVLFLSTPPAPVCLLHSARPPGSPCRGLLKAAQKRAPVHGGGSRPVGW